MRSIILAVLVVSAPLFAQATLITTIPEAPLAGDAVTITVSSDWGCPPTSTRIEVSSRTIDVVASDAGMNCPPAIWNWVTSARTAPLTSGQWTVRALKERENGEKTILAERELLVRSTGGQLAVSPTTVPVRGGMIVRMSREGIGSCPSSGACLDPVVTVGGVAATLATIDRDAIDVVVPAGSKGSASVTVLGRDGAKSWTAADALYYFEPDELDPSVFERVLVPLMFEGPGAFGSQWTTELRIFNGSFFSIDPLNRFNLPCQGPYGCPPQIPANKVLRLGVPQLGQWQHGYVLAVPHEVASDLHYGLHIRDLSRQGEGWGTEIPVIPASAMTDSVTLLDVPLDDRYRRSLRVYGIDAIDGTKVTLIWHRDSGSQAYEHITLRTLGRCVTEPCWLPEPAGAVIPLEKPFPQYPEEFQNGDRVRLELRTVAPAGAKIWAFVSLTNNETQQVTTITPQ